MKQYKEGIAAPNESGTRRKSRLTGGRNIPVERIDTEASFSIPLAPASVENLIQEGHTL